MNLAKKVMKSWINGIALMAWTGFASASSDGLVNRPQNDVQELNHVVNQWIKDEVYPRASLLVVNNGQVIIEKYWGMHREDQITNIASATKWLEVAAILTVVDEGKISLDAPIKSYLPELTGSAGQIKFRQLLSHTSGLNQIKYPPSCKTGIDMMAYLSANPNLPPKIGTEFYYGATGLTMAAVILERATGQNIDKIFEEKIALPLGMSYTRIAGKYYEEDIKRGLSVVPCSIMKDYIQFLIMLLNKGTHKDKRILSEKSIQEMFSDQVQGAKTPPDNYATLARGNTKGVYGLGCWREAVNSQGDATIISSPGWSGFYPWIDLERNICGVFSAKVSDQFAFKWDVFHPMYKSASLVDLVNRNVNSSNKVE